MAFSSLYSAVCRGKWFISFRDVEANLILVDKLLERGITKEDATKRSDVEPIPVLLSTGAKETKSGNGFSDAPKDSTAIIPIHSTVPIAAMVLPNWRILSVRLRNPRIFLLFCLI